MGWWIGPALFVLIVAFFVYAAIRGGKDRPLSETLPDETPLPVDPDREEKGVQAIVRIPVNYRTSGKEYWLRLAAYRPDGKVIAGYTQRGLRFFDGETGIDITEGGRKFLSWGASDIQSLAWSSDGSSLFAVVSDPHHSYLLQWDSASGRRVAQQGIRGRRIETISPSPDGNGIAWFGGDSIGIWEPGTGAVRQIEHDAEFIDMAFVRHLGGRPALVTMNGRYEIVHHDAETLARLDKLELETECHFVDFIDGGKSAVFAWNGVVELHDTRSGELAARQEGLPENLQSACAGPGFVAFGGDGGIIVLCGPEDLEILAKAEVTEEVSELVASETGLLLSLAQCGSFVTEAEIWNTSLLRNWWARESGG